MDVLKLTAIGHLACDPESGHETVKLSLVANHYVVGDDGDQEVRTATVAVYAHGALAKICEQYLKQGSRVYCEAHIEQGGYIADEIIMLASAKPKPEP